MSVVVPFPEQPEQRPEPAPDPNRPPPGRATLQRIGALPPPVRVVQGVRWWLTEGLLRLGVIALKAPYLALLELGPILRGAARVGSAWVSWVSVAHVTATETEKKPNPADLKWAEQKRSGRRGMSLVLLLAVIGACWWAALRHPLHLALAWGLVLVLLDALGHAGRPSEKRLPPPHRAVLKEGVPLHQVVETIVATALREGREVGIASPLRYDATRRQYHMMITCLDPITPETCRALERALGAANHAIRALPTDDDEGGVWRLVIREGDPLSLEELPTLPPPVVGSRSIEQGILVGASMTETPFLLPIAGQHGVYVAKSGGGKTSWMIRDTLWALKNCPDSRELYIDLTDGPESALWQRTLYRRAVTPAQARVVLEEVAAELRRRARVLARFAEDDDPSNDHIIEWNATLGPYWVIIFDEFPVLSRYPELLTLVELVFRTGRKHGICAQVFLQKTGNDDAGSTVPTSQANIVVAGPCTARDAGNLFGVERRDGGYAPHELKAGTVGPGGEPVPRDAGKVFLDSPFHHTADVYRYARPPSPGEVKALCRRLVAEGYRDGWDDPGADEELAVEVDPLLAALERVFAGRDRASSAELCEGLAGTEWEGVTQSKLAELLAPHGMFPKGLAMPGGRVLRGYQREHLERAITESGTVPDDSGPDPEER